jgi:hypothetical protein
METPERSLGSVPGRVPSGTVTVTVTAMSRDVPDWRPADWLALGSEVDSNLDRERAGVARTNSAVAAISRSIHGAGRQLAY